MSAIDLENRFVKVMCAACRVRQLEVGAETQLSPSKKNFAVVALEELSTGKLSDEDLLSELRQMVSNVHTMPQKRATGGYSARDLISALDADAPGSENP